MAIPIGVLVGAYRFWEAALEPLVDFIRYMPVVAFVPLTILWAGHRRHPEVPHHLDRHVLPAGAPHHGQHEARAARLRRHRAHARDDGPRDPGAHRRAGRGARRSGTRCGSASAGPGRGSSLAELVAATSGLGYRITAAQRFFQTDTIIGYILASRGAGAGHRPGHEAARAPVLRLRGGSGDDPPRLELVNLRKEFTTRTRARSSRSTAHRRRARGERVRLARRHVGVRQEHAAARSSPACRSPPTGRCSSTAAGRGPGSDRGVVFQSYTLFPWLSARGNIEFALRGEAIGAARATRDARCEQLTLVGSRAVCRRAAQRALGRHEAAGGDRASAVLPARRCC